jgi:hypothetical protein
MTYKQILSLTLILVTFGLIFNSCSLNKSYHKMIQGTWVYDLEFYKSKESVPDTLIFREDSTSINIYVDKTKRRISKYYFSKDTMYEYNNSKLHATPGLILNFTKNRLKVQLNKNTLDKKSYLVLKKVSN